MQYPLNVKFRYEDKPFLIELENIYSEIECSEFIKLIEINRPEIATNNPSYRNQDRVIIDDQQKSEELYSRIKKYIPERVGEFKLIGLNERLRFYRYSPGQKFEPHMDHWYQPTDSIISLYSVLLYFNSNFTGGETKFMEQIESTVLPAPGKVAVFQHKLRHEGCEVLSGTKYAVRTDVMYEKT